MDCKHQIKFIVFKARKVLESSVLFLIYYRGWKAYNKFKGLNTMIIF